METSNSRNVGWRFLFASLFYLFLFLVFFNRISNKSRKKNELGEFVKIENDIYNDNDNANDKTEPFMEGRL